MGENVGFMSHSYAGGSHMGRAEKEIYQRSGETLAEHGPCAFAEMASWTQRERHPRFGGEHDASEGSWSRDVDRDVAGRVGPGCL